MLPVRNKGLLKYVLAAMLIWDDTGDRTWWLNYNRSSNLNDLYLSFGIF